MTDLVQLSASMQEFLVTGNPALGEPTLAQKLAKLLLIDFYTPAEAPAQVDVSKRRRYTLDVFGDEPVHGRTCTLRVSGSSAIARPRIFMLGVSYTPQVDTTVSRFTSWDDAAVMSDKMVKGLVLEVDTRDESRVVQVEGDGVQRATITVQARGRKVLHFAWPQFQARMLRFRATGSGHWRLYKFQWIFDEEPLELERWETQPVNHGIAGFHSLLTGDISYRSTAPVTLEISAFQRRGSPNVQTVELPATANEKNVEHVQTRASQGLLYKYLFYSREKFHLYREESSVMVQAWGAPEPQIARPFGTDDMDKTRDLDRTRDVGGMTTAARSQGGSGV